MVRFFFELVISCCECVIIVGYGLVCVDVGMCGCECVGGVGVDGVYYCCLF